jgi:hypothetical protein
MCFTMDRILLVDLYGCETVIYFKEEHILRSLRTSAQEIKISLQLWLLQNKELYELHRLG